jgi:hypothetical protein
MFNLDCFVKTYFKRAKLITILLKLKIDHFFGYF